VEKQEILINIEKHVVDFRIWVENNFTSDQINNEYADYAGYPLWNEIEEDLEKLFTSVKDLNCLQTEILDKIIFFIARQWDIGIILNWFNKGGEDISGVAMTQEQLIVLAERGILSKYWDARYQFSASLFKVDDSLKDKAITLLLKYHKDNTEDVRSHALRSLNRFSYSKINDLLIESWDYGEEFERIECLKIWRERDKDLFNQYFKVAKNDNRETIVEYVNQLNSGNKA